MRRRLDAELVRRGIVDSRESAQEAIAAKKVTVGGAIADKAARQVAPDEPIEILAPARDYVGRGGTKLAHALDAFAIEVAGKRCLDIGASTGGFTDCLLQRGAEHVYAVDVGRGQLHQKLRDDPRVDVREGFNARELRLEHVENRPVDIAVADVSFISLRLINPATMGVIDHSADVVYLVKPQFEARKNQIGKRGVVSDPAVWVSVLSRLLGTFSAQNLYMLAVTPSPIRGAEGNVEFLVHLKKDHPAGRLHTRDIEALVTEFAAARKDPALAHSGNEENVDARD